MARYLMFSQVYYHPTRLIYDAHLKDFLTETLDGGHFSTSPDDHLKMTDIEVTAAMRKAARKENSKGRDPARRLLERNHFRVFYERRAEDVGVLREVPRAVFDAAVEEFGPEVVRHAASPKRGTPPDFPVLDRDGRSVPTLSLSEVMRLLPVARDEYVFIAPELRDEAKRWRERELSACRRSSSRARAGRGGEREMTQAQREAILSRLAVRLRQADSWCGETHVQKSAYLLELLHVPLGYPFTLYKYGPFSFDLRDELGVMQAEDLLELVSQDWRYGPRYVVSAEAKALQDRHPQTLTRYEPQIDFIASEVGSRCPCPGASGNRLLRHQGQLRHLCR